VFSIIALCPLQNNTETVKPAFVNKIYFNKMLSFSAKIPRNLNNELLAVSPVRPVPLFLLIGVRYGLSWNK